MNKHIIFSSLIIISGTLCAQTHDTIKLRQTIGKSYIPQITQADKIEDHPDLMELKAPKPQPKPTTLNKHMVFGVEPRQIMPARMKGEPLNKLYRSQIKLGLGSYTTTYGELFINSNRSRKYSLGAHLNHLASSGQIKHVGYSGFSENALQLYGKKFLRRHLLTGSIDAGRNIIHFYGYDPAEFAYFTKENTRQRFLSYNARAGIKSFYRDSSMINYTIALGYHRLSDLFHSEEDNIVLTSKLNKYFNDELFVIEGKGDFSHFKTERGISDNTLIMLNPKIISKGAKWRLNSGLGVYADAGKSTTFHFYPDVVFRYNVVGNMMIPYAGIKGEMQRNHFAGYIRENPWLISDPLIKNSNVTYKLFGGIRGVMGSDISYRIEASKSRIKNMPLFITDLSRVVDNQFAVTYDQVAIVNLAAEVNYRKLEKLDMLIRGDYYHYDMTEALRPWHLPTFRLTLTGVYDLKDKIVLRTDIVAVSSSWANVKNASEGSYIGYGQYAAELKGTVDLNAEIEYRYTKKLSAFIRLNNIGNIRYYAWNNYPSQRFSILGGVSYSFWGN